MFEKIMSFLGRHEAKEAERSVWVVLSARQKQQYSELLETLKKGWLGAGIYQISWSYSEYESNFDEIELRADSPETLFERLKEFMDEYHLIPSDMNYLGMYFLSV